MMNVNVITVNDELIDSLKKAFDEVNVYQTLDNADKKADILIMTNSFVPYYTLSDYQNIFSDYKHLFFVYDDLNHEIEKNVQAICSGYSIKLLSGYLNADQIVDEVLYTISPKPDELKRVFTFFSSSANVGTTSTVYSVAQALSDYTDAKIGLLMLNAWDSGIDFMQYDGSYLDELKPNLFSKVYESDENFLSAFAELEKDSLYVLAGNRNPKLERLFTKKEIQYVIERAKKLFDIVLIDAGSHFDNANMVQALYSSDYRYVVINQQEKTKRKWKETFDQILNPIGFKHEDFMFIVNQYKGNSAFTKTKEFHQEFNIPVLVTINDSRNGWLAEFEKKPLYDFEETSYLAAIDVIAKTIAMHSQQEFKERDLKRGLFRIG